MTRPKWLPEWLVYEVHEDQIAEHGGRTGDKFISTTRAEFWRMFWSAVGGGIIIYFIVYNMNMIIIGVVMGDGDKLGII